METESDHRVDVSVLVLTRNCRAHLDRCLTSLLVQRVDKQIVVVDDGSSDGTRDLLDLYAAHHPGVIKVIRQDRRTVPARLRNRALAEATGRYVFFCDGGDHLGPDALRRMVAAADANSSDIVLGKIVRRGRSAGHPVRLPEFAFRDDAAVVTLLDGAYETLSCFKLFRRATLERHGIRFDETLTVGDDMAFAVHAYCHAGVVSVVAGHDCYHLTPRRDGGVPMAETAGRDPLAWLRMIRTPLGLMAAHIPPGPLRDHLLLRHFRLDVFAQLGAPFLAACEAAREKIVMEVADICAEWLTDGVRARLGDVERLRAASLDDPDRLVRLAHVETASMRHRLLGLDWIGDRLGVSGSVSLAGFDGEACLVLRERTSQRERRVPVARIADRFGASIEVASLDSGIWDVHVAVECEGVRRLARLRADPVLVAPAARFSSGVVAVPFLSRSQGYLGLDVGGHLLRVPGAVRLARAEWTGRRLRVEGQVHVGATPGAVAVRHLIWRERASGRERRQPVVATGSHTFAADSGGFSAGTWDAYLELDVGGPLTRFPVKVDRPEELDGTMRWWSGLMRWTVRPYATAVNRRLSTSVHVSTAFTLLGSAVRKLGSS
ncbi:glycosyltransferase family 2 protein [Planotetraspora kaengkrachanensis]|uniref:Glycosyl transferase n=1 Tax=Planotetraspora kaengkrachanensis TaxID=575193 RepID=A0A8J3VBH9_9ACTN|nr:glycosyltransferase family 2 protein [Planotetraspora kaengkrachanensis]GIG84835.1 glycosyl transferase [Planotetraspora kaengkrachanensis]